VERRNNVNKSVLYSYCSLCGEEVVIRGSQKFIEQHLKLLTFHPKKFCDEHCDYKDKGIQLRIVEGESIEWVVRREKK
jgi:hypothetical protein